MCIALVGLVLSVSGCTKGKNIPNVDHIEPAFTIYRADQALNGIDSMTTDDSLLAMQAEKPSFWELYFTRILPTADAPIQDTSTLERIRYIAEDDRIQAILDSVSTEYTDLSKIEREFYRAFQFYEYHFPGNKAPNLYTLISDFSYFPFIFQEDVTRDGIGISLEMFLGHDFPYAAVAGNHPVFSAYLTRTYNSEHLVKRSMDVIIDDILGPPPGDRLLDLMIHNGKKLYITELLLPEHPDSVWFEFTPEQLAWCQENEKDLWAHYLSEDLLYSNNFKSINKLVSPSPNVPGMPAEAPGRVANWSGWRIVHEAMRRNPDMKLLDLIALRDAQAILEMARYRPR